MKPRLPYIDNAKAVLITLAINICALLLFNWPGGISYAGAMWDSLFCAVITTIINMCIVYGRLLKMRKLGAMPVSFPESKFIQRLPQNPILLVIIYATAFAAVTTGINAVILLFFGIDKMSFLPWAIYKLIYSTVLSIKIVEFCIFRYVQPDWANAQNNGHTETGGSSTGSTVKNPWPSISLFKEIYGSVTANIVTNLIIGSILGGVITRPDGSVLIFPTTVEGIPITGLAFGLIAGILVTKGIVTAMDETIIASIPLETRNAAPTDRRFTWMPVGKVPLTILVCICLMIFSALALPAVMMLFGKTVLNFFQYSIFITVYATIICKPLSFILIQRCMQSDYISVLKKRQ